MHHRFHGHSLMQYDQERRANQRIMRLQVAVERTEALNDKLGREIRNLARQNWRLRGKEMKTVIAENMNKMVVRSPCSKKALQRASRVLQYSKQREIRTSSGKIRTNSGDTFINSNSLRKSAIQEAISNSHKRIEKWQQQLEQIRHVSIRLYDSPLISKSDYQFPSPDRPLSVSKSHRNEYPKNEQLYGSASEKEELSAILKQKVEKKQVGEKRRRTFLRVVTADQKKRRALKENDGQKVIAE